jgi:hypothetical protein
MAAALNVTNRPIALQVETFSGLPQEDFQGWLFNIEMQFRASNLSEAAKISFIVQCLRGEARAWLQNHIRNAEANVTGYAAVTTWEQLKTKLKEQWEPQHADLRNRLALFRLRQTGSLTEFINEFFNITSRLGDMPENEKVAAFINGYRIDGPAYHELVRQDPTTVAQAIAIAQQYERIPYPTNVGVTPMEIDRLDGSKVIRCNNCGGLNHLRRHCLADQQLRPPPRQQWQRQRQQRQQWQPQSRENQQQRYSNNPFRRNYQDNNTSRFRQQYVVEKKEPWAEEGLINAERQGKEDRQ